MGISGKFHGIENDRIGLNWLWKFGWLRSVELGRLLWPGNSHSNIYACNLTKKWRNKGYVIERVLPENAGSAYVLAAAGVEFLAGFGISAKTGKDWGETFDNKWIAPKWWRHDLLSTGVLALMHERGWQIITEKQLRRENPYVQKLPDGLAIQQGQVVWLEIESHRKTGKAMDDMATALIKVAKGKAPTLSGYKAHFPIVAYSPGARDERGHKLSHQVRVVSGLKRHAENDVLIVFLELEMVGAGVSKFNRRNETIEADKVSLAGAQVEWEKEGDNQQGWLAGIFIKCWPDNGMWKWETSNGNAETFSSGSCKNMTEAKRAAVTAIVESEAAYRKCA